MQLSWQKKYCITKCVRVRMRHLVVCGNLVLVYIFNMTRYIFLLLSLIYALLLLSSGGRLNERLIISKYNAWFFSLSCDQIVANDRKKGP